MAYDNNINPGNPPIVWSSVKDAFDKVNENFTIIGSTLARERQLSISHIESGTVNSNPVRVVTTELHDLTDNQIVNIFSSGVSQLDGNEYYVKKESDTEVFLYTDQLLTTAVDGTAFDAYASGGGFIQGGSEYASIDFENLTTNISSNGVATFNLGSVTKPWKSLYTGEHADNDANAFNGVWLGSAQIKGKPGGIIDLPLGSTVNGSLIINPDQTFFKSVQVDSGNQVVADDFVDTLNLISGTAISMAVDSAAESITITNTGVTQLTAGLGLGISSTTGNITVTNIGVRSIQSTTALPSGRTAGAGINIDNSTGDNVKITNAGVLEIQPGSAALTVFTDAATGIVTITNASPAGNAYRTVDVKGTFLAAPSIAGTLVVEEGNGIVLTGDSGTQTLNIAFSGQSDITGSVFADDSTLLVDAVDAKVVGNIDTASLRTSEITIALGNSAGFTNQGAAAVAIGPDAGSVTQGVQAIAIGKSAGETTQGISAVAVGPYAGNATQGQGAVAVGSIAGQTNQGAEAVAIGYYAGNTTQGVSAVAIGNDAGNTTQGAAAVAIGQDAGKTTQGVQAVAVGYQAGSLNQGYNGTAVGTDAGSDTQGNFAVAIGFSAGTTSQGISAVAIGDLAGSTNQGEDSIAIGKEAGRINQGAEAVAIGNLAGVNNQAANSIVINAGATALENTVADTFVVKPIRSAVGTTIMMYDVTSGEVTHTASPVITGDLTGSVFADDSTMLVDGTNGVLRGTHVGDVIGSVFADNSTLLVNGVDGTLAYDATIPGDWDGDAPTTVGAAIDRLATLVKTLNGGTGA